MKAVITVTGKDTKGIIAKVSTRCADFGANILDITQSVLQDYFAMMMLVDIDSLNIKFGDFVDELKILKNVTDLLNSETVLFLLGSGSHILAVNQDHSGRGRKHTCDHIQQCGFSTAGSTQKHIGTSGFKGNIPVRDLGFVLKLLTKGLNLYHKQLLPFKLRYGGWLYLNLKA